MADKLKFTKDGLRAYTLNSEARRAAKKRGECVKDESRFYDECVPDEHGILSHLRTGCDIEDGVTLLDFFRAVDKYELLKLFVAQYSWCRDLDVFHKEAERPPLRLYREDEPEPDKLSYLEIFRRAALKKYGPDEWVDFHGIGEGREEYGTAGKTQAYSVSCTPMYDLARLPLRLNRRCEFRDERDRRNVRVLWAGDTQFTLLDILDAVYWDISFYGGPEDNAEFLSSMRERVEEIESAQAEGRPICKQFDRMEEKLGESEEE
jgi:hypothetical protein